MSFSDALRPYGIKKPPTRNPPTTATDARSQKSLAMGKIHNVDVGTGVIPGSTLCVVSPAEMSRKLSTPTATSSHRAPFGFTKYFNGQI